MSIPRTKKLCKGVCNSLQFLFSGGKCLQCYNLEKSAEKKETTITKKSPIKKQTEKNKAKRKEDRAGFAEFFQRHCQIIKDDHKHCENCGCKLQGISAEVGHILSKNQNASPEMATVDENVVYLCFWGNGCHTKFDSSLSVRLTMPIFKTAAEKLKTVKHLITGNTKEVNQFLEYYDREDI